MRLVFIDDSEQTSPPRRGLGHLLALGAVIVPQDEVAGYAADLLVIKDELGIPLDEEIKWKSPKGTYLAQAGGEVVGTLRRKMLDAALSHNIRTIVVIIDHHASYTSRSKGEVGMVLLKWLYERVSMHLSDSGVDDLGLVIADKPGGGSKEEYRWLAETLQLTRDGTEYVAPDRVVMPIVTAASHHVPHLQLADLVVAATTAAVAGHPKGLELGRQLAAVMHRHYLGDVNGAGLVLFPTSYNLLFHCFGETGYSIPSKMAGVKLPFREWEFADDDGLRTTH